MRHFSLLSNSFALGALTLCFVGTSTAQTLTVDVNQLPVSTGGTQTFALNAGAAHASELYLLLGSMTGTVPGQIAGAFVLPLNFDPYFLSTLVSPNAPPLQNSFGILSPLTPGPGGTATANFTLPPGLGPSVVGLTLQHAFVTSGFSTGGVTSVSNAVALDLVGLPSGLAQIPGGSFVMGDHQGLGAPDELPLHTVTLDSFFMVVFETTNGTYADYLNSAYAQGSISVVNGVVVQVGNGTGYCDTSSSSSYSRIAWNGSVFTVVAGKLDHPMNNVTWYGAVAFANWRSAQDGLTPCYDLLTWSCNFSANGYRLPTEAEWEYAARGGLHSPYYTYAWGNSIDGSKANYKASGDPFETGSFPWSSPVSYYDGGQTPGGVDMANGYGLYDMAGNMWEWCGDWWDESYYSSSPSSNPHGPSSTSFHVIRGGSWVSTASFLRTANRSSTWPDNRSGSVGFRLIRATMK